MSTRETASPLEQAIQIRTPEVVSLAGLHSSFTFLSDVTQAPGKAFKTKQHLPVLNGVPLPKNLPSKPLKINKEALTAQSLNWRVLAKKPHTNIGLSCLRLRCCYTTCFVLLWEPEWLKTTQSRTPCSLRNRSGHHSLINYWTSG